MRRSESYLVGCVRRLRETGEAIVMADQSISSLTEVVKSNIYTKICMSQSGGRDIQEMKLTMGLDKLQAEVLNKLEVGQAIVKLSGRFPYPMLGQFPFVEPKYLNDERIDELNSQDDVLNLLKSKVVGRRIMPKEEPAVKNKSHIGKPSKQDEYMVSFLKTIYFYQFQKTLIEIYKNASLSTATGSRINKKAVEKNFIKVIKTNLKRGKPKYPFLLDEGYKAIDKPNKYFYAKGAGPEHFLYQNLIAEHLKEFNPVIELNKNGKFIDVGIQTKNRLIAIEVAVSPVNEKENIEKDIQKAGAYLVVVTCVDKKVMEKVREIVDELPGDLRERTKILLISELLKEKGEELVKHVQNTNLQGSF